MSPTEISMSKARKLSAVFPATAAVSMLFGTPAFAETRHRDETNFNDRNGSRQGHSTYDNRGGRQNNSDFNYRNDRNDNSRRRESFQGRVSRPHHHNAGSDPCVSSTRLPFYPRPQPPSRF